MKNEATVQSNEPWLIGKVLEDRLSLYGHRTLPTGWKTSWLCFITSVNAIAEIMFLA